MAWNIIKWKEWLGEKKANVKIYKRGLCGGKDERTEKVSRKKKWESEEEKRITRKWGGKKGKEKDTIEEGEKGNRKQCDS